MCADEYAHLRHPLLTKLEPPEYDELDDGSSVTEEQKAMLMADARTCFFFMISPLYGNQAPNTCPCFEYIAATLAILCGYFLNPFPVPGIQSVRPSGPSGRRERPRGRPDPPDGSPGPWEHKEGGHQRTRLPTRPSRLSGLDGGCPASRHAQPVNHGTSLSDPAATLATVSFHKVEHLCQVPLDGSDALLAQTCSAFLNMSAAKASTGVGSIRHGVGICSRGSTSRGMSRACFAC